MSYFFDIFNIRSSLNRVFCTVDIDLGLKTWIHEEKLRLARINAPEMRGADRPQGILSRDFLKSMLKGREVVIETVKDKKGKYGRYLAEIWIKEDDGSWSNVNDQMVEKGFAAYKEY